MSHYQWITVLWCILICTFMCLTIQYNVMFQKFMADERGTFSKKFSLLDFSSKHETLFSQNFWERSIFVSDNWNTDRWVFWIIMWWNPSIFRLTGILYQPEHKWLLRNKWLIGHYLQLGDKNVNWIQVVAIVHFS